MMFKKISKISSLTMVLIMMMLIFTVNVSAETTTQTIYADRMWSYSKSTGEFVDRTGTTRFTREGCDSYIVFDNIMDASAFVNGATFSLYAYSSSASHEEAHNAMVCYVSSEEFPDDVTIENVEAFKNAAGTQVSASTAATYTNNKLTLTLPPDMTYKDGDTIVIYQAGCAVHSRTCYLGGGNAAAGGYASTIITYNSDIDAVNTSALSALNGASNADDIDTTLNTYQKLFNIDKLYQRIKDDTEKVTSIAENILEYKNTNGDFDSVEAVTTVYSEAYYSILTAYEIKVDKVYYAYDNKFENRTSDTNGARAESNGIYYVFNDIVHAESMIDAIFHLYWEKTSTANTITVYVADGNFPQLTCTADSYTADTAAVAEFTSNALTATQSNFNYSSKIETWRLPEMDINDGDSVAIYLPEGSKSMQVGLGGNATVKTKITYDLDEAAFNEKVLYYINNASDVSEMAKHIDVYKKIIGIEDTVVNISSCEEAKLLLASKLYEKVSSGAEYSSFEAIADDYQAAYDEADMLFGYITLTDADDGATVYGSIADAAGKNTDVSVPVAFADAESYFAILAFYGEDGLLQAQIKEMTSSAASIMFDAVAIPENITVVKIMAWENLNTAVPLCHDAELN